MAKGTCVRERTMGGDGVKYGEGLRGYEWRKELRGGKGKGRAKGLKFEEGVDRERRS